MPRRAAGAGDHSSPGASAMDIALRYLAARPRSRWELERRLRRGGVGESAAAAALDRLAELGYVDDAAFARWLGEQRDRHAPRGARLVEAELRRSGVAPDVIAAYRDEHATPERSAEDTALPGSEAERARHALARHLRGRPLPEEPAARRRIGQFLMRRGFDADTVRSTIRDLGAMDEADDSA